MLIATSDTRSLLIDRPPKARGGEPPRSPTPSKSLEMSLGNVILRAEPWDIGQVGITKSVKVKGISIEQRIEI